jgi:hypothetical protein
MRDACGAGFGPALVAAMLTAGVMVVQTQTAAPARANAISKDHIVGKVTLSLEDKFAIQELFARYSQDMDLGNGDDLVTNVFAPNGVFDNGNLCLIGSAELKSGLANHLNHVLTSQHWPNNIVITEGSGDRAKVHSYVFILSARQATPSTYHDTLVKIGGKWLIQERLVVHGGQAATTPAKKKDARCPIDLQALER